MRALARLFANASVLLIVICVMFMLMAVGALAIITLAHFVGVL
jgi:hypothetical protein